MKRYKSTPTEPITRVREQPPETGPESAGQSGDLQGLSGRENSANESSRELLEEGQAYEASVVDAIENAPEPEGGPLHPRRRSEDDLPQEYANQPPDEPKE